MADKRSVGRKLVGWVTPPLPGPQVIEGRAVRLERMDADTHAAELYAAYSGHDDLWDYMPAGPFSSASAYHRWVKDSAMGTDPMFYVMRDSTSGHAGGVAAFMRVTPEHGSIEVGNICIAPVMQRTVAATEAMFLMMDWAFRAGYRRYEWKCNALNLPSRRAAQRYGYSYEGVFRQHFIVKGRNRDTAWFSVIDSEWSALREAYLAWFAPSNFDAAGKQRESLADLTRLVRAASDPLV